jgi:hypothetical protein
MSEQQPRPVRARRPTSSNVFFRLPAQFEALCAREGTTPKLLLQQFVADLCDMRAWTVTSAYAASSEEGHRAALAYYRIAQRDRENKRRASGETPTGER